MIDKLTKIFLCIVVLIIIAGCGSNANKEYENEEVILECTPKK